MEAQADHVFAVRTVPFTMQAVDADVLLRNVHGKQRWSCRDSQFLYIDSSTGPRGQTLVLTD